MTVKVDLSTGFLSGPLCPLEHIQPIRLPAEDAPTVVCPIHNPQGLGPIASGVAPDLLGLDLQDAVTLLARGGFVTSLAWADAGPLAQGTVFAQDPAAGTGAGRGSTVRLTVAGPEPGSTVPAVLGLPLVEATVRFEEGNVAFQVLVLAEADPGDAIRRTGLVWKQDPAAGELLPGLVTIWVNP